MFGNREVIATGEQHMLGGTYLEKRRRVFEAERCGFIQPPSSPASDNCSTPNCHFLYFRNGTRQGIYMYMYSMLFVQVLA